MFEKKSGIKDDDKPKLNKYQSLDSKKLEIPDCFGAAKPAKSISPRTSKIEIPSAFGAAAKNDTVKRDSKI